MLCCVKEKKKPSQNQSKKSPISEVKNKKSRYEESKYSKTNGSQLKGYSPTEKVSKPEIIEFETIPT